MPPARAAGEEAACRHASRQPLWLETTDPLAAIDIPAFCTDEGHRLSSAKRPAKATVSWSNAGLHRKNLDLVRIIF